MANFSNATPHNSEHLGIIGELNFDEINHINRNSKKIPQMNPLTVTSGLYIPPEETQKIQQHDEVAMDWGMSDDQQDSDDDMDGNEFDIDFEDAEFLPPLNYAPVSPSTLTGSGSIDQDSASGSNSHSISQSAYDQAIVPPNYVYQPSSYLGSLQQYPFYGKYNPSQQMQAQSGDYSTTSNDPFMNAYDQRSNPPLEFINPSRLQLPAEDADFEMEIPSQCGGDIDSTQYMHTGGSGLNVDDLGLDMELDELYPVFDRAPLDQRSAPQRPAASVSPEPLMTPFMTTTSPSTNNEQPNTRNTTPTNEPVLLTPATSPAQTKTTQSTRRKARTPKHADDDDSEFDGTATRRKPRRYAHSSGAGVHVCDKVYPDGTQCNRSFTRSYDLARHHETLHAPVRKTYKCTVCGNNSKTFSRLDALSRHMRLKHPGDQMKKEGAESVNVF